MSTYAIGDIQGCFVTLTRLLQRIEFDPTRDRILQVGDLVNRGPHSLDVLRWARRLGDRCIPVLGNHDLHLIARAEGVRPAKRRDTLDEVLAAPDRDELLDWLIHRPLLHREGDYLLVHAGLLPSWSVEFAEALAREAETALRSGEKRQKLLKAIGKRGDGPTWDPDLSGISRLRTITNAFTRLRTCSPEGKMCLKFDGPPEDVPRGCRPWFQIPNRAGGGVTTIFGHWAALGLRIEPGIMAIDSACVWGGALTAIRLEDRSIYQEPLADKR